MPDTPPTRDRLSEDFSYVRAALDRQRTFVREYVPIWFAAVAGMIVIGSGLLKDLQLDGVMSQATRETGKVVLWGVAIALVIANWVFRRKLPKAGADECAGTGRAFGQIIIPWVIYAGGIILIKALATQLGVDHDTSRAFFLAYSSAAFMLIGFGRLNIIFGFGAGLGLGALLMYFGEPPYPFTWLGVLVETGLVGGAWLDHRAYVKAAGGRG